MTNEELISKYDPANALAFTEADLEEMRKLDDAQIDVLAKAYPNQASRRAYIILYDTLVAPNKQLYQLSTWQNLRNVRKFNNRKNLIPYSWQVLFNRNGRPATGARPQPEKAVRKTTVDLTAMEAADELRRVIKSRNLTQEPAPEEKTTVKKETKPPVKKPSKKVQESPEVASPEVPTDQDFSSGTGE